MRAATFLTLAVLTNFIASGQTQAQNRKFTVTDATKAGVDFKVQGEYVGFVVEQQVRKRVGLQVIAQGQGNFRGVIHVGGLPGDGWDGEARREVKGKLAGKVAPLSGNDQTWSVGSDGVVTVESAAGMIGTLKKVERVSPTMGAKPTAAAQVLFDGTNADQFTRGKLAAGKLLLAGTITKMLVHDFHMHIEFRTPFMPNARGQGRGNSGVYIQKRYEVQVLDSFGLSGAHNECGGLYRQRRPDLNMCYPPLSWQTYDIDFRAARWSEGKKVANARITVRHNGVLIHDNVELTGKTGAGDKEAPTPGPIRLQWHGNPVHYRNIWIEPKDPAAEGGKDCRRRPLRRLIQRLRRRRCCR